MPRSCARDAHSCVYSCPSYNPWPAYTLAFFRKANGTTVLSGGRRLEVGCKPFNLLAGYYSRQEKILPGRMWEVVPDVINLHGLQPPAVPAARRQHVVPLYKPACA